MKALIFSRYLFIFISSSYAYTVLPSYIKPCSRSDPKLKECAMKNGMEAIPFIRQGDATYHIPNFQPFKIDKVNLEASENIKLSGTNIKIEGIDLIELKDINWDLDNKVVTLQMFTPLIRILGTYNMNGHILVLTLKGSGAMNNSHYDNDIFSTLKYSLTQKTGKEYLKIDYLDIKFKVKSTNFNFENILDNPVISKRINEILNENANILIDELIVSIEMIIKDVALGTLNPIADKVPFDNIMLP